MDRSVHKAALAIEKGILRAVRQLLIWFFAGWLVIIAIQYASGVFRRDDTDGISRSGMKPHTDNATGCQYLSVPGGGITPRLDGNGQHRGCRTQFP